MQALDQHDTWVERVFGVPMGGEMPAEMPAGVAPADAATNGEVAEDAPTSGFIDDLRSLAESARKMIMGEPDPPPVDTDNKEERAKSLTALGAKNPEAAKEAGAAFDKFDKILGTTVVTPELSKKATEDRAAKESKLADAMARVQDIKKMPTGPKTAAALKKAEKDYATAKVAADKSADLENAIIGRASLTKAISHGPLSAETGAPFKDETAQKLIAAYGQDARMADAAVSAASTAKFPDVIGDNVGPMITQAKGGFAATSGENFNNRDVAKKYGQDLLKSGGDLGPKYFDRLPDYIASGQQFSPDGAGDAGATSWNGIAQNRSRKVADSLIAPDGGIDVNSAGAKAAVGNTLFHPNAMRNKTPGLSASVMKTMDMLGDPTTGPQASAVLKGVTAPATPGAQNLVRGSLGKGPTDPVDEKGARTAVLTTLLQPVDQGPVGSCFTTAPARKLRETEPIKAMEAYAGLATKGTIKPGVGPEVPAVTNLPPGEDPIGRAWEYTTATAAANNAQSRERANLTAMTNNGADLLKGAALKGDTSADKDKAWKIKKAKLVLDVTAAFTFTYDPVVETEKSADGSSSKGRFVIVRAGKEITSKADFEAAMIEIALASLGCDAASDAGKEVAKVVKSPEFAAAVCPKKGVAPWQLEGGGYTDESMEALSGTKPTRTAMLPAAGKPPPPEGERTKAVFTAYLKNFRGSPAQMSAMDTAGQHSFNAMPNDPSLAPLQGKDDAETEAKLKVNLLDKGKAMKDTVLTPERAGFLFDEAIKEEADGQSDPEMKKLIADGAAANRPRAEMKPAELAACVEKALDAFHDKIAQTRTDSWKASQTAGGKPPNDKDTADHKATLKKGFDDYAAATAKNGMMKDMGAPQFVIADTNWGSARDHTFFVIAPDPVTGEPQLWMKAEPPGRLRPAPRDWVDRQWQSIK